MITGMAMDADFRDVGMHRTSTREADCKTSPREPQAEIDPIAELERTLKEGK
jgi:hypothetical protein